MKASSLPRAVTHHLLLALMAMASIQTVRAHGWMKSPAARNLMAVGEDNFYQQMSLNRCVLARHSISGTNSRAVVTAQSAPFVPVATLCYWNEASY